MFQIISGQLRLGQNICSLRETPEIADLIDISQAKAFIHAGIYRIENSVLLEASKQLLEIPEFAVQAARKQVTSQH